MIETTPGHPYYTDGGEWVAAGLLEIGDQLQTADGGYGVVEEAETVSLIQPMYNLTVAEAHTFFVGEGAWLVHNSCFGDINFRGLNRNRAVGELTHNQIYNSLSDQGLDASSPFIKRLRERGTTLGDLEKIFKYGQLYDAGDGVYALVYDGMAVLFDPNTGRLIDYRWFKDSWIPIE